MMDMPQVPSKEPPSGSEGVNMAEFYKGKSGVDATRTNGARDTREGTSLPAQLQDIAQSPRPPLGEAVDLNESGEVPTLAGSVGGATDHFSDSLRRHRRSCCSQWPTGVEAAVVGVLIVGVSPQSTLGRCSMESAEDRLANLERRSHRVLLIA
ncbi:hypothetical protein FQZ97_192350 [compost metagenome]